MKKFIVLISCLLAFASCERGADFVKDCNAPTSNSSLKLSIDRENWTFPISYGLYGEERQMQFASTTIEGAIFNEIIKQLQEEGLPSFNKQDVFAVVLYTTGIDYGVKPALDQKSIYQIGVYHLVNHQAFQTLYSWDKDLETVANRSFPVRGILTNTIQDLQEERHPNKALKGFIILSRSQFNHSRTKWSKFDRRIGSIDALAKKSGPETCGPGCTYDADNTICEYDDQGFGGYNCSPGICADSWQAEVLADSSAMSTTNINNAHDFDLHYDFRDDFLIESTKGRWYADRFYVLSGIIDDENLNVTVSMMVDVANFLIDFNGQLSKMIDHTNNLSTIFLTTSMADDLRDILDDYRALSTNSTWTGIIDDIHDDIDTYEGKSIGYITSDIGV